MAEPPVAGGRTPVPAELGTGLGVYVHVPFCGRRCDYCAFATWTGLDHLSSAYVDACLRQLRDAYEAGLGPAATVFFGGGTPSRLDGDELARLLEGVHHREGAEVTVECNPEDVTVGLLRTYAEAGVNRISLGVQSLAPHVLAGLGRSHSPAAVPRGSPPSARSASPPTASISSTAPRARRTGTGPPPLPACSTSSTRRRT